MIIAKTSDVPSPEVREAARRKAQDLFSTYDERAQTVKQMLAQENAARDERTVKLRALRLAKEAADAALAAAQISVSAEKPKASRRKAARAAS